MELLFAAVNAVIAMLMGWIAHKLKLREELHKQESKQRYDEYDALKTGTRALLRDRIVQACNFINTINGITSSQMQNITELKNSYVRLGGNGATEALYNKTISLPTMTDEEFIRKSKKYIIEEAENDNED